MTKPRKSKSEPKSKPRKPAATELAPRERLHKLLRRLGASYDAQAYALRAYHGIEVSGSYLSLLVRRKRNPSVDLAQRLAKIFSARVETILK